MQNYTSGIHVSLMKQDFANMKTENNIVVDFKIFEILIFRALNV